MSRTRQRSGPLPCVVEYIGYDQWAGAAKLAEYACSVLDNRGNVYILTGIPGFQANRRTQGFK